MPRLEAARLAWRCSALATVCLAILTFLAWLTAGLFGISGEEGSFALTLLASLFAFLPATLVGLRTMARRRSWTRASRDPIRDLRRFGVIAGSLAGIPMLLVVGTVAFAGGQDVARDDGGVERADGWLAISTATLMVLSVPLAILVFVLRAGSGLSLALALGLLPSTGCLVLLAFFASLITHASFLESLSVAFLFAWAPLTAFASIAMAFAAPWAFRRRIRVIHADERALIGADAGGPPRFTLVRP